LEFWNGGAGSKNYNDVPTINLKKFDDMYIRSDALRRSRPTGIGRTDGRRYRTLYAKIAC